MLVAWWGSDDRHQKTLKLLKLFESKHPGLKMDAQYGGLIGYQDKISTQFAGGSAPDIMQISDNREALIASGRLLQLDDAIASDKINLADANKSVVETIKVGGKLYSIPWGLACGCYFLDTKVFQDTNVALPGPDWTWDQLCGQGQGHHQGERRQGLRFRRHLGAGRNTLTLSVRILPAPARQVHLHDGWPTRLRTGGADGVVHFLGRSAQGWRCAAGRDHSSRRRLRDLADHHRQGGDVSGQQLHRIIAAGADQEQARLRRRPQRHQQQGAVRARPSVPLSMPACRSSSTPLRSRRIWPSISSTS